MSKINHFDYIRWEMELSIRKIQKGGKRFMAVNDFIVNLVAGLSKTKSKQQIKSDAKSLGDMYVKLIGNLDMSKTRKAINAQLKGLNNLTFNITPNVNTKGVQSATKQAINNAQRVANNNKVHLNFDTSKQQLVNQIKILGRNNNKLFNNHEMTAKYNQLLNAANVAKSTGELKTLRGELSAFKTELVATNNAGMTWGSKFKESVKSYTKFFSGASLVYAISNQVRNAATEAKTLDDSLVNLQKVTDEISDRDALYKYFDKSLSKAQELNVKVGSLIDAVTELKKLGWDLDDAELGAKWANILSNVGDVDIDTAIGSIKTSIASFDEIGGYGNDQMDKKLEAYTDLINNMSNKYSIDAEGLAESIRLSAGTLTEAHMSIEQAATMFATANKYYNDPSYLGNTAKIGSLRMRASSGDTDAIEELQEMGEEVDDLATATSNLREKLMALTGVDIMEDEHTFKSYYDQLYEISQIMDKLDDTSRANVLETMFGKSRSAAGAAILSGMKESASAYEDAINSAGSATEEYQTWMTSADAACQRFSNTLTETYQSIINGNTVRDLANLGSAVLEFANNWGIVEGTLKGVIALNLGKFIATGGMALITATKQVEQYGKALQKASNVPNGNLSARFQALKSIAQATSTLTTEQLRNVLATNTLTQADRVRILQMQGMTKEMALQKLAEMNLTQATNAQTAANTTSTASTFSLKAAMTGLGATLKSVFLSNPVGIVLMGISLGVSAVTSAVSKHNQAVEEARQKAKEAADAANTLGDEIATLANKYIQLSDAVKTDASAKEDLMTTQTELLKKLGLEGESIDDLIAKYGSLSNAIKQASIDSLKNQQTDLIAGVNAAKEELMDVAKDNFWGTNNIISASGEEAVKAFKELEKAGVIDSGSYGTGGGQLVLIGDDTVEGALENYKKLEDAVNALRDSEAFTADELSDNSLFNSIYSRYSEMKESVEAYNSSIDNLNENLAQQTMLTALQGNELPKTEEDFNKFKQELIDTAVASEQFIGNEKEITDAINNYLSTVPEFEGYYSIPLENELDKVDELLNQEDFSKTFTDTLAQVQALSEGLDQLDKIYADVYDKEDFDWSSILNNEDFKKQFGELGSVYDDFIKTIANSPSDLGACQSAFNKLTTEYINNSDVMKNLTEDTKAGTVAMLEQMGVANAEEMVEARLAAQKYATANGCIDLANATWEEISALIAEGNASQETQQYLANLALSKIDVNNIKLDTKADVDNIIAIANAAGASAAQIGALKTALASLSNANITKWDDANKGGGMGSIDLMNPAKLNTPSSGNSKIDQFAKQQQAQKAKDAVQDATDTLAKTLDDIKNGAYNLDASNFYANYSGGSATKKAVNDAAKAAKDAAKDVKEAVAETFDFIENGINRFDKALSKLEDKAAKTSSSFTSRLNAYKEALNAATFGIELLTDDYNKYMQKANEVGLNEDIASAVRGGASNIWDYSDDTVKQQIKDYQNWYDKAQDCLDKIDELKDKQLELTQASIELLITQYEKLSTKVENANDRMEKWISLKESWGFSANTKNYDSMNKNIKKQIDYINKQDEQLKLLQKTVTKGSEAWYEYNERIDSNKSSLIELKQQMQENATAAAALAKATADKKTEKYDSQDELYDAKIDNATSAKSKNKLIDKKISNINKTQKAYNTAVSTDNKNLKSAKKTISKFKSTSENKKILASIKKAAKSGKRISQSLLNKASKLNDNGKLYNACVQYNAYLDAKEADKATADLYKETAKQDKATLAKEKFDNISSDYENKISSNEQKKTSINNKISLAQEQGKQVSTAYYKSLISAEKGEQSKLIKERKKLQKSLNDAVISGSIKKGSDEWLEMVSAINEVTNAIDESTQSIVEFQNALRQLKWDTFDKSLETVKRVNSEADYYIDLLSHKDMTDKDTGNFTEYGIATIGLHKTNYDNYIAQAEAYQNEYNNIMEQIRKGELSTSDENVIQRLRDLQDAHREAKKSAEDELESINDLVKQGYEAQTDALSKLIEKYKKLKDSELDAYKYQKEITEKTKQIASLQKQLIPYSNNDTEESRAQIQKLKVELQDAKDDLKDTQYEKFISDTEDMLDDLMNDYQEFIDEKLNDTNTILDSIKELLGGNDGIIATLKSLDSSLTNTTKDQIDSSTTNGGDGGQGAKDYVHNTVTNDQNKVNSKTDTSNYDPAKEADIAKKKNGIAQKKKAINGQRQSFQNQIKELESQLKQLYGELNSIENKYQFEKSSTKNKDKLQDLKNNYIEKKSGLNAMIQDVTHNKDMLQQFIADLDKQSAQLDKDLASINGYEKGSEHIDKRQLAWTQENKRELIYRAADGALLTELNPGDKVFTNEMTENLWELAKTNPSLLYSSTNFVPKLPDIAKSAGTSTIVEVGDIVMNGVNDPETFGRQLREEICKNGKTTQCITEAVSAKQLGKNGIGNARLYK
jgi:DNA repair exonuclease SbcCD ATPase subunit